MAKKLTKGIKSTRIIRKAEKNHKKPIVLLVTGTPCTGKTTLARFLAKKLVFEYLNVNKLVKEPANKVKLSAVFDKKRQCYIIDPKKLNRILITLIKKAGKPQKAKKTIKGFVIDSLISHFLPCNYANLCLVCTCKLKVLKKRLQKRGYPSAKVRENLDAEIFEVCLIEAREKGHRILIFDSSAGLKKFLSDAEKAVKKVLKL